MKHYFILLTILFALPASVRGQLTDTLVHKLDSMHRAEQRPENKKKPDVDKFNYTKETNITPKSYVILLATDLTQQVTGPFHTSGKTWLKVAGVAAVEAGLIFADKPIARSSQTFMHNNPGMKNVSEYISNFGASWEGYTLAAFGAYGLIFKSNKVKTTTLLATQSYLAAGAVSYAVKFLTGRQRPHDFPADNLNNLSFKGPSSNSTASSFPSGHTTAAFSAATVFAIEYKDQILIPVIAYTAATLVGLSRITENAHWATDVLGGAALGYVTGRQVSFNYHRYARLRSGKAKTALLFNVQYFDGMVVPGLVYKF